ncbi:DUF4880 domain-containing protein [Bordetella petrii]|nr:DUF4880 domain-containing protein [Bordetella petrii]
MNAYDSTSDPAGKPGAAHAALREQAQAWALKLKTGQPDADDVAAFHRWRNQSADHAWAWSETCKDWKALGESAKLFEQRYRHKMLEPRPRQAARRWFLAGAASACGAVAVAGLLRPPLDLWPSWSEMGADYRTDKGEQRALTLAGQVQVSLNTQTSIAVQTQDGVPRVSLISGEAAIATRGAACDVLAQDARLAIVDGDFELRTLPDGRVRVRCNRGQAQLHHTRRTVALSGHEEVLYDRVSVGSVTPLAANTGDWRHGVVMFDNLPLDQAIDEINRYRPGRVVLINDALAARRFTAKFQVQALDDAIELMEQVLGVRVRRVGDLVLLT